MKLTEAQLKNIVKKGVQRLTEGRLANNILASERVMDELSKQYASMVMSDMKDPQIRKEMVYFLEQNCGVCERPDAITKALIEIWDKIQTGAKKYGYSGPITPQKKEDEIPEYLKERAERLAADEHLMRNLGASYYFAKRRGGRAMAWEMSPKNEYGMVNTLRVYPEYKKVVGYLEFNEAKIIIKYLSKEIKAAAKKYEAERAAKETQITEAAYKEVVKRLKLNG